MKNIIVVADIHAGCKLGLCPSKVQQDEGGWYTSSPLQQKMWRIWEYFWHKWVPLVTKGEDYIVVVNGDAIDGVHHGAVTQISHNITTQVEIAKTILEPIVKGAAKYFHIRGTEAHVGKSGQAEEGLAKSLGAIPDDKGNHARWELWLRMGGRLVHFTHHIGATTSAAYESTAVHKELTEVFYEAGRAGVEPPDVVVRSHRHRQYEVRVATSKGYGISLVTPSWQLKTPFTYSLSLARNTGPQLGGYLIRIGDEDGIYTRFFVRNIERPKEEQA